ncbi:MAG: AMP-binding protein, partial [bacterium]|nr:AMP-binding protein [bacterium]
GNPKGVVIRHKGFVNMVYSHKKVFEREPGPRRSQVASPGFDAMAFETWPCLLSGAALYMANNETRMDPCAMKNWLLMTGIMHSFQSTLMAEQLINEPWPRRGVALKVLQTAGDKLTKYPNHSCTFDFYNLYGPTESTVWTTWTKVETKTASSNRTFPVIGKPISNLCIYIMGPGLELKPPGVSGELCVAGEGIAVGYLNQPELTHKKFNHWQGRRIYKTGDLARWLPDGNIEFLGRIDFQVKIRGFRVEPGEIENRLLIHKDVRQAVVVATEVAPGEKCLCAYTIVAKTPAVGELRAYLSKTLPHYMVPSYFVQLESFPLTPSGKVNRKALPPVEIESSRECIPPRDEIEKKLLEIWTGILNVKKELIGIDTDFFQLGGQSLKATLMVAEINRIFQVRIPLLKIFKIPSIRRISEFIKNGNKASKAGEGNDVVLLKEAAAPRPGNIFWIHDGTGEVDGYLEFCNKLQGNLTCWGIRAQRLINFAPQNLSVGDMARTYIDRMKKLQPQGPYYVGSWSIGGIVAFEMVRQLEQAGEKIAFFALIDSPAPPKRWLGRNISITPFSLQAELDMIKDIIPHQRPHPKFRQITHMEQVWPIVIDYLEANGFDGESITKIIQNNGIPPMADNTPPNLENTIYYLNLGRTLKNAWAGYSPGKIDTPIHYFRATDSKERHGKSWKKHASKPIRFYDINGDHYSILKPPGVARFAKFFDEKIAIHSKP